MSRSAPLPVRTDRDPLALRSSARSRNDCSVTSYTSSKSCGVSWIRSGTFVSIRLDLLPGIVAQRVDLDLAVEMADVADDGSVLHMPHVVDRDHVDVAGRGDKDVACAAASSIEGAVYHTFRDKLAAVCLQAAMEGYQVTTVSRASSKQPICA